MPADCACKDSSEQATVRHVHKVMLLLAGVASMDEGISPWDSVDGLVDGASDVSVQFRQEQQDPSFADSSLAEAATQAQEDAMRMLAAGVSLPHPGGASIGDDTLGQLAWGRGDATSHAARNGDGAPPAACMGWGAPDQQPLLCTGGCAWRRFSMLEQLATHVE